MTLRSAIGRLAVIAIAALFIVVPRSPSYADPSPFDTLLGSWGGTGEIRLDKGRKERLKCNAYYTGGGSDLGLAIRCQSDFADAYLRLVSAGFRVHWTDLRMLLQSHPQVPAMQGIVLSNWEI